MVGIIESDAGNVILCTRSIDLFEIIVNDILITYK